MKRFDDFSLLPIVIFAMDARNGQIVYANPAAQAHEIRAGLDAHCLFKDGVLPQIDDSASPQSIVMLFDGRAFDVDVHLSEFEHDGRTLCLVTVVSLRAAENKNDVVARLCGLYTAQDAKNEEKDRLRAFLRIAARSIGAFSAALYEKKGGRYVLCEEWRERKCVCIPTLGTTADMHKEAARLAHLKRARDAALGDYVKPYGTQGIFAFFFDEPADESRRVRVKDYAALYRMLSPEETKNDYLGVVTRGLDAVGQGFAVWDRERCVLLYANRTFRGVFGTDSRKLRLDKLGQNASTRMIFEYEDETGRVFSVTHTAAHLGRRQLIATCAVDITRHRQAQDRLEQLAQTDALTGLKNRRAGLEVLHDVYMQCRKQGRPLTVCFADIDGLKRINDTYGHGVGDNMIRLVSGMLKKHTNRAGTVCRLGGDEFVLILPGYTKAQAMVLAAQVKRAVDRCFTDKSRSIAVSFGFKEAEYTAEETDATLISVADSDMYREKRGRN